MRKNLRINKRQRSKGLCPSTVGGCLTFILIQLFQFYKFIREENLK